MSINRISKEPQKGRSLIETLSMLAIMGVLSAVGVWGYKMAVQRHKSNELLSAANAIAHTVAMQYMVKESASISDMKNYGGFNFEGTIKTWGQQFGLRVKNVDEATCQYVFRSLGDRSILRWIGAPVDGGNDLIMNITQCTADNDLVLYYNKDLTTTAQDFYKTDFADKQSCENAGQSWCGKSDGTGLCYNNQCLSCQWLKYDESQGKYVITTNSNEVEKINITASGKNNISCTYHGTTTGTCYEGTCISNEIEEGKTCTSNTDCGGVGSGYYCKYNDYCRSATFCWNTPELSGGADGHCTKVGSKQFATTDWGVIYRSTTGLNFWSAKNWCSAQGMTLFDFTKLNCSNATAQFANKTDYVCCASGDSCSSTDISSEMTSLQGVWSNNSHWTNTQAPEGSTRYPYAVNLSSGQYQVTCYDQTRYALCQQQ